MTKIIGPTATEFAALDRGATLILGVPREGMAQIVAGQELLAVDGWNWPDAVKPDARKVRLRVMGQPYTTDAMSLSPTEIAKLTGRERSNWRGAIKQLKKHWDAIALERRDGFSFDPKLAIPVAVLPGSQEEVK